jgi:hypothetical protein
MIIARLQKLILNEVIRGLSAAGQTVDDNACGRKITDDVLNGAECFSLVKCQQDKKDSAPKLGIPHYTREG